MDPGGIVVSAQPDPEYDPAVASNGTDYFVVWRQVAGIKADLYGARVTSAGVVQDTSGIAIATSAADHLTPRVASNGTHYLVVWTEFLDPAPPDIHGARVTNGGSLADTTSIVISNEIREQYEPDVASNGTDFFVVWTDYRTSSNNDIYGARVSGAGVVLDASGLALCTDPVNQRSPKAAYNGTDYVAAWADYRYDTYWDVYATQVTSAGTVVTPDGFAVAYNVRETEPLVAMASGNGHAFVAYSRYDTEPGQGHRRIRPPRRHLLAHEAEHPVRGGKRRKPESVRVGVPRHAWTCGTLGRAWSAPAPGLTSERWAGARGG